MDLSTEEEPRYVAKLHVRKLGFTSLDFLFPCIHSSLQDVINGLKKTLQDECFTMVVRGEHVLLDCLQRMGSVSFSPKRIRVIQLVNYTCCEQHLYIRSYKWLVLNVICILLG